MSKTSNLRLSDLRAVVRLIGECRDLGDDAVRWRVHLGAGLARLVGAGVVNVSETTGAFGPDPRGLAVVAWGWDNGFEKAPWEQIIQEFGQSGPSFNPMYRPYVAAFARSPGASLGRPELLPDGEWYRSEYYDLHRQVGCDAMLLSYQSLSTADEQSSVVLVRAKGEPDFSAREQVLVRETHAALTPLLGGPLARFADPSPSALPPRTRQVLLCLLEGDGDKQIATRLRMSRHTVNGHTKRVYGHFRVAGRAELLALWVRRGWGGRMAWADPG